MVTTPLLPVWLRDPRYTGANRCLPCTVVNLAITAVLALGVSLVSVPLGVVTAVIGVAAVAVRGYLVPGTPTLTKRYLPDRVLAWFDKGPAGETGPFDVDGDPSGADSDPVDAGAVLVEAGVLVDDPVLDDLVVEPSFETTWIDRARELADRDDDPAALARLLDVDAEAVDLVDRGHAFVASVDGVRAGRWESRQAFLVDMAADELIGRHRDDWRSQSTARRSELLGGLRLFVESCPTCDGTVTLDTRVVESCCRQYDVLAATCDGCGARLFEADIDPEAIEAVAADA